MDVTDLLLVITGVNLLIASVAVTVDLFVVFRIVWLGIIKEVPANDWPLIGKALRSFAETERAKNDLLARRMGTAATPSTTKTSTGINVLSGKIIYPELHASLGFGFMEAIKFLIPPSWKLIAFGVVEAILVIKEAAIDPRIEVDNPFFWSGVQDLAWYQAGLLIGWFA